MSDLLPSISLSHGCIGYFDDMVKNATSNALGTLDKKIVAGEAQRAVRMIEAAQKKATA
jgi:hypothetical protein